MNNFLKTWGEASYTSIGFFWMSLWAFILGYLISSMIQVFITEERMRQTMGDARSKGMLLATFFGFISSSCSFSALATTKSLFRKGASLASSVAFLLASTNLVIELGIIIFIFLGWQFVVGEYVGGLLLILISYLLIKLLRPKKLVERARDNLEVESRQTAKGEDDWLQKIQSEKSWAKVAKQYAMEWKMVWKDVTIGFTIAGIVAVFVPDSWFSTLFINTGGGNTKFSFFEILEHIIVGPVAAFMTFIGSMGNIPLAAILFGKGVSFAGVMAFIFSDLVVFPVLRINARYYGWKMSLFLLFLLFVSLVSASFLLHYSMAWLEMLPDPEAVSIIKENQFGIDYTFFLNLAFLVISGGLLYLGFSKRKEVSYGKAMAPKSNLLEVVLKYAAYLSYCWLIFGLLLKFIILL